MVELWNCIFRPCRAVKLWPTSGQNPWPKIRARRPCIQNLTVRTFKDNAWKVKATCWFCYPSKHVLNSIQRNTQEWSLNSSKRLTNMSKAPVQNNRKTLQTCPKSVIQTCQKLSKHVPKMSPNLPQTSPKCPPTPAKKHQEMQFSKCSSQDEGFDHFRSISTIDSKQQTNP